MSALRLPGQNDLPANQVVLPGMQRKRVDDLIDQTQAPSPKRPHLDTTNKEAANGDDKDSVFDEDSDGSPFGDTEARVDDQIKAVDNDNDYGSLFGDDEDPVVDQTNAELDDNDYGSLFGEDEAPVVDQASAEVDAVDEEASADEEGEDSEGDESTTDGENAAPQDEAKQNATPDDEVAPENETYAEKCVRLMRKSARRFAAQRAAAVERAAQMAAEQQKQRTLAAEKAKLCAYLFSQPLLPTDARAVNGIVHVNNIVQHCGYDSNAPDGTTIGHQFTKNTTNTAVLRTFNSPLEGIVGTSFEEIRQGALKLWAIETIGWWKLVNTSPENAAKEIAKFAAEAVIDMKMRFLTNSGREIQLSEENWTHVMEMVVAQTVRAKGQIMAEIVARVAKAPVEPARPTRVGRASKRV